MHKYTSCISLYMPEKPLIAKLFSGDFQKNIVQRRKLGKYSSEGDILTMQIIQKTNQIMLSTCAAERENLIIIMQINIMRKIPDILKVILFEKNCFLCDRFSCFDHFL